MFRLPSFQPHYPSMPNGDCGPKATGGWQLQSSFYLPPSGFGVTGGQDYGMPTLNYLPQPQGDYHPQSYAPPQPQQQPFVLILLLLSLFKKDKKTPPAATTPPAPTPCPTEPPACPPAPAPIPAPTPAPTQPPCH